MWAASLATVLVSGAQLSAQRVAIATRAARLIERADSQDAGALAGSQMMTLMLHLASTPTQTAALDALLVAQTDRNSPDYHRWLTPQAFAESFAPSEQATAQLVQWLSSNGLTVTGRSASGMRLTVTGPSAAAERAFAISLRRVAGRERVYFANQDAPTLPESFGKMVAGISGLDDLPSVADGRLHFAGDFARHSEDAKALARVAEQGTTVSSGAAADSGTAAIETTIASVSKTIAAAVDENLSSVLSLESELCGDDLSEAERADLRADLRQAQAQGITVLVGGSCSRGDASAFPSSLAAVTAVTLTPAAAESDGTDELETRPGWQAAPGLPVDSLRHAPDFATPTLAALSRTVTTLVHETGARIGNLGPTLYALAKSPGLFAQVQTTDEAEATRAGDWRPTTGLGTIDLQELLKLYPRVSTSTTTSLTSSSYAVHYGDSFVLTSAVQPASYGATSPTGTVTFTSLSQGVLGSTSLINGSATLTQDVLPVGQYKVIATYSGDGVYAGSTSTWVTITVSIVNATVTATLAPQVNVPYGATATVTATVMLPGANASPTTTVSATVEDVTGSIYTAMLSPNAGGNTATANIVLSVPPPGNHTIEVTCMGTSNFQCQTPVLLTLSAVKGYTNTTVSVAPVAPQAGQPVVLTATVANSGNGTASYTYTGSIAFYDSGKLLTVVPVATNQATTKTALSGNRAHNIVAVYSGDANWSTSTSGAVAVAPTVLPDLLTVASNAAGGIALSGVNIIFTGTATAETNYGVGPTGLITFFDLFNGAVVQLGSPATMVPNGTMASLGLLSTTGLLPGVHHIYASYSGDDNYAASESPAIELSLSNFSVSMTPTSLNLLQGRSQQVTVLVGSSGGFAGTVVLGCVPPASSEASCSFSPSSITGGGATLLTITTTAASANVRHVARAASQSKPGGGTTGSLAPGLTGAISLATLVCLSLPRRGRKVAFRLGTRGLLTLMIAVTMIAGSTGCGLGIVGSGNGATTGDSSGTGTTGNSGTPLGTQNFTITAAASDGVNTVSHTYQYQVTVQ